MTRRPTMLAALFVRTINRPGLTGDGRGRRRLSLRGHRTVGGRITKTWLQCVRIEGRLTLIGLGPYPEVTLPEARRKALDHSRMGRGPCGRVDPTFAETSERTIRLHRDARNDGSPLSEQWKSTLRLHSVPLMGKPVDRAVAAPPRMNSPRTEPVQGRGSQGDERLRHRA